jgi:TfoX/Sxy family transcriptional regulator of competence genes
MQEPGGKISGSKIDNSGNRGGNGGLTRARRRRQSRRYDGRRTCPSVPLGRLRAAGFAAARPAVCTLVAMAYDQELAGRIRQLIGSDPELTEKKMFGGLAFLIRGNMAIAAASEGGAMVRVDPAQSDALVATTKATLLNMRGRDMPGWLRVSSDELRTDDRLAHWVEIGTGYARSLPPKWWPARARPTAVRSRPDHL